MISDLRLFALVALIAYLGPFDFASAADAQQPAFPRRIGVFLMSFSPESKEVQAFRQGLQDAGYAEGRDVLIEWRFAKGDYAQVPGLVADLLQSKVEVIVADSTLQAGVHRASRRRGRQIPGRQPPLPPEPPSR